MSEYGDWFEQGEYVEVVDASASGWTLPKSIADKLDRIYLARIQNVRYAEPGGRPAMILDVSLRILSAPGASGRDDDERRTVQLVGDQVRVLDPEPGNPYDPEEGDK